MNATKCGWLLVVFLTGVVGCAASYKQQQVVESGRHLNPELKVLISQPENGTYGDTVYSNSGRQTVNAVRSAFAKMGVSAEVTEKCHGANCLVLDDIGEFGYYVQPEILHWEDRATEWSGKSDRLEVQLIVYESKSGKELANVTYKGKSQWLTFGGDHPQDLLAKPTEEYVASLYGPR